MALSEQYAARLTEGTSLGLFQPGAVREKDHLLLWPIARFLLLETYLESGVRAGSSLHAFSAAPTLAKAVAIDPELSQLRLPAESTVGIELIDSLDFSQVTMPASRNASLVYFDDHVGAVSRNRAI